MGQLAEGFPFWYLSPDTFTLGEANLAAKSGTNTVTSTIQDEEDTAEQLPMSIKRRKIRTAKDGSMGFRDIAGVESRSILVAASVIGFPLAVKASRILQIHRKRSHVERYGHLRELCVSWF